MGPERQQHSFFHPIKHLNFISSPAAVFKQGFSKFKAFANRKSSYNCNWLISVLNIFFISVWHDEIWRSFVCFRFGRVLRAHFFTRFSARCNGKNIIVFNSSKFTTQIAIFKRTIKFNFVNPWNPFPNKNTKAWHYRRLAPAIYLTLYLMYLNLGSLHISSTTFLLHGANLFAFTAECSIYIIIHS